MKRSAIIISILLTMLFAGISIEAGAHRHGCCGLYGRGYGHYRSQRVWVAPAPRIVVAPRYGYYRRPAYYYRSPRYHRGPAYYSYSRAPYGYRRRW